MASLIELRVLETRLHSHLLEWDDVPLQNELLFLLDDLQVIHEQLDQCGVPSADPNGSDMTLLQRVRYLIRTSRTNHSACEYAASPDLYGQHTPIEPQQLRLL
jgi:hypothetical protein